MSVCLLLILQHFVPLLGTVLIISLSLREKDIESGGFRGEFLQQCMFFFSLSFSVNILVETLTDGDVSLLSHLKSKLLVSEDFERMCSTQGT